MKIKIQVPVELKTQWEEGKIDKRKKKIIYIIPGKSAAIMKEGRER